ncbi:MAG: sensor domain-containing diguanylate cyclase [Pseudomonadota bacterium]|nr:sensor domain-containing diguanylate cyclase [Pseudomonadota bacterium]
MMLGSIPPSNRLHDLLEHDWEQQRQAALDRYQIVDSAPERAYDDLVALAQIITGAGSSVISLLTGDRQWVKARVGTDVRELPRAISLCDHAIRHPDQITEVPDAREDARFVAHPLVTKPNGLRFYAGMPILSPEGWPLGTLCVFDCKPGKLDAGQREALMALARQAERMLELRRLIIIQREQLASNQRDQVELQRRNEDLHYEARHDTLTGLLNRAALREMLASTEARERLSGGQQYSLAVIDIDHFKRINDAHGHLRGDETLRAVAEVIRRHVREDDVAVRYGGEELLIGFPRTSIEAATLIAERIRKAVAALPLATPVTVSIGLASGDPHDESVYAVFDRADRALYRAKQAGRDRLHIDGG